MARWARCVAPRLTGCQVKPRAAPSEPFGLNAGYAKLESRLSGGIVYYR
jgi:hypothetical protein